MQATACRLAVRSARAQRATRRISGTARPGTLLHGAPRAAAVASAAVASGATAAALCASSYAQCIPRTRSWEDIPPQVLKDIQFAIRDGEVGLLKVLLRDHRVSVSTTINVSGKTLLAFTAERGQLAAVRYLLKRGADVNATDCRGFTALEYAAWKGHAPVVEALLQAGAKADTHDIYGLTPIHKACGFGHAQVVGILVDAGGVSPNFRTGEVTAPADHESAPKQLDTPLHVAARLGNTDTVGLLLQSGADVNARNVHGRTPLHEACRKGHAMAAAVLKCHGADAQIRTLQDKTPAQEAVSQTLSLVTRGPAAAHCLATAWC